MKEPEKWAPASALEPVSHSRPDQEAPQPGDSQLGLWTLQGQGLPKNPHLTSVGAKGKSAGGAALDEVPR